jgi:hypothetical protein
VAVLADLLASFRSLLRVIRPELTHCLLFVFPTAPRLRAEGKQTMRNTLALIREVRDALALRPLDAFLTEKLNTAIFYIETMTPSGWGILWNDGERERMLSFPSRESALTWLQDRRNSNSELDDARLCPLYEIASLPASNEVEDGGGNSAK